jgi:hypothetical protein
MMDLRLKSNLALVGGSAGMGFAALNAGVIRWII